MQDWLNQEQVTLNTSPLFVDEEGKFTSAILIALNKHFEKFDDLLKRPCDLPMREDL
jgi:hypothetical protein